MAGLINRDFSAGVSPEVFAAQGFSQPQDMGAAANGVSVEDFATKGLFPEPVREPPPPSEGTTALHAGERGVLPAAGGWAGMAAGAKLGAIIGAAATGAEVGSPTALIGAGVGGFVGGLGGGFAGAAAVGKAQQMVLDAMPEAVLKAIGQSRTQQEAEELAHPYIAQAAELAPNLFLMRPGAVDKTVRAGASMLERALAHPVGARVVGAGLMGTQEAATEAVQKGEVDPVSVALSAAAGALMNKETEVLGKGIRRAGEAVIPNVGVMRQKIIPPGVGDPGDANVADDVMQHTDIDSAIDAAGNAASGRTPEHAVDELLNAPAYTDAQRAEKRDRLFKMLGSDDEGGTRSATQNDDGTMTVPYTTFEGQNKTTTLDVWDPATAPPDKSKVTSILARKIEAAYRKLFDTDVVWLNDTEGVLTDGAHDRDQPNTIFLSNNPSRAITLLAGHEFGHDLESVRGPAPTDAEGKPLIDADGNEVKGELLANVVNDVIRENLTEHGWQVGRETFGSTAPSRANFGPEGEQGDLDHSAAVSQHIVNEMAKDEMARAPAREDFANRLITKLQDRFGNDAAGQMMVKFLDGIKKAMSTIRELLLGDTATEDLFPKVPLYKNLGAVHDSIADVMARRLGDRYEVQRVSEVAQEVPPITEAGATVPPTRAGPEPVVLPARPELGDEYEKYRTYHNGTVEALDRLRAQNGGVDTAAMHDMRESIRIDREAMDDIAAKNTPRDLGQKYDEAKVRVLDAMQFLKKLDADRREKAKTSAPVLELQRRIAEAKAKPRGGEKDLTKASKERIERWQAELDDLLNPTHDTPDMALVREKMEAQKVIMAREAAVTKIGPQFSPRLAPERMALHPETGRDSEIVRYGRDVEDVPIDWLKQLPGNLMRKSKEEIQELAADIRQNGIHSPLIINVGKDSRTAKLGEGNHRLEAARLAGYTHVPARVEVGSEYGSRGEVSEKIGTRHEDLIPKAGEYFPAQSAPSKVFRSLKAQQEGRVNLSPRQPVKVSERDNTNSQKAVDEILSSPGVFPHPFMRGHYTMNIESNERFATIGVSAAGPKMLSLDWISAYPMREGIGMAALKRVQEIAAKHGLGIKLYVWDKGNVSRAALTKVYKKAGFEQIAPKSAYMEWKPTVAEKAEAKTKVQLSPRQATAPDGTTTRDLIKREAPIFDVLGHIKEHSADPFTKDLAAALEKTVPPHTELVRKGTIGALNFTTLGRASFGEARGEPIHVEVSLRNTAMNLANAEETFLHEAIHAATFWAIEEKTPAGREINRVFEAYVHAIPKNEFVFTMFKPSYGFTENHEFVAELANPRFRALLKTMRETREGKTLWQRTVDAIARILGLKTTPLSGKNLETVLNKQDTMLTLLDDTGKPLSQNVQFSPRLKKENAIEAARTDQGHALPSRLPTSKKATVDITNADMTPDMATLKRNPEQFKKAVDAVGNEPGMMPKGVEFATTDQKAEYLVQRMVDNLLWLHDKVSAATRNRSRLWYDGAQAIATQWATKWAKTRAQTAGMLAVLSPQKDWFMNTTMAERVGDILHEQMDHKWDKQMTASAFRFLLGESTTSERNRAAFDLGKTRTLGEVIATGDKLAVGIWIRAYDEAHHAAAHAIITPEGNFSTNVLTGAGDEARRAWGDFTAIGKAASIFVDGSMENISVAIGGEHKVRNFFNNIFNAGDWRFATIDTHAVAADLLRPLAGKDKAVNDNFGGTGGDNATGISGSYPLHLEAYRRAAAAREILPREMQSITWEAVRGLFTEGFKTEANKKAVDDIWRQVDDGTLDIDAARKKILKLADGIKPPDWHGGPKTGTKPKSYVQERGPHPGNIVTFEVAPDPRNTELKARWDALNFEDKAMISHKIAWDTVKNTLEKYSLAIGKKDVAIKGELHQQLGGWGDSTNPSMSIWLDPSVSAARSQELARVLGYALNQEGMMFSSPEKFKGGDRMGTLHIELGSHDSPAEVHAAFQALRAVKDADGNPLIMGHTTKDGDMIILYGRGVEDARELARRVADEVDLPYTVSTGELFAAFPEKGENDYALSRGQAVEGGSAEPSVRAFADQLRGQAARQLEDAIAAREGTGEPGKVDLSPRLSPEQLERIQKLREEHAARYEQERQPAPEPPPAAPAPEREPRRIALKPMPGTGAERERALNGQLYNTAEDRPQRAAADALIARDQDKAIRVAMRYENAPSDVHPEFVYIALKEKALRENDAELWEQMSRSRIAEEATTMGQRISALRNNLEIDPAENMRLITEAREARLKRKGVDAKAEAEKAATTAVKQSRLEAKANKKKSLNEMITNMICGI